MELHEISEFQSGEDVYNNWVVMLCSISGDDQRFGEMYIPLKCCHNPQESTNRITYANLEHTFFPWVIFAILHASLASDHMF